MGVIMSIFRKIDYYGWKASEKDLDMYYLYNKVHKGP